MPLSGFSTNILITLDSLRYLTTSPLLLATNFRCLHPINPRYRTKTGIASINLCELPEIDYN